VNGFVACLGDLDAGSKVSVMLRALQHRAKKGFGIISDSQKEERRDPSEFADSGDNYAIGYAVSSVKDKQFSSGVFHGEIFGPDNESHYLEEISQESLSIENLCSKLSCMDGTFAFMFQTPNGAVIARDPMGIRPLYIARVGKTLFLATEFKAFTAIGLTGWDNFPPGTVLRYDQLSSKKFTFSSINFSDSEVPQTNRRLLSLIESSVRTRASYIGREVAIAFSGGIDSVLLTSLLSKFCKVHPICVSVQGSPDEVNATRAAALLGLDLDLVRIENLTIPLISQEVSKLIEVEGVMNLSIGIVLHEAARRAHETGFSHIVLGQLADELYGGYSKYLALRDDSKSLRRTLYEDVANAHIGNFERDDKTTAPFVRTIVPYAYVPLVKFSLRMPLDSKIDSENRQRKKCLREAALLADVPQVLALQDKKAMQYGSGVQRLVTKLQGF